MTGKKRKVLVVLLVALGGIFVFAVVARWLVLVWIPMFQHRGQTAIHIAAREGDVERLKRVLRLRMSVDSRNTSGETALHIAAYRGDLDMVRFLLDRGADPSAEAVSGSPPITYAARGIPEGASGMPEFPREHPLYPAEARYEGIVKLLLNAGAEVEVQDWHGFKPLHHALRMHRVRLARLLLQHGADPNVADRDGLTPLHYAASIAEEAKALDAVESLLGAGATTDVRNDDLVTPLTLARRRGHDELVRLLREDGAEE